MKRIRLRGKLILGSLIMIVLVMLVSAVIVSLVIENQNRKISDTQIENALKIIQDDLNARKEKLTADCQQASTSGQLGSKIQFVGDYKKSGDKDNITVTSYQEITASLFQIAKTGNMRLLEVYDAEGDLVSFYAGKGNGASLAGFVTYTPKVLFHYKDVQKGQEADLHNRDDRQDAENSPDQMLKTRFEGMIPNERSCGFEKIQGTICLTAYTPVFGNSFNQQTNKVDQVQVGFVRALMDLGEPFTSRMTFLTGTKVNLFCGGKLSAGALKEYVDLVAETRKQGGEQVSADGRGGNFSLNEITAKGEDYYQGLLPLKERTKGIGAVAVLHSKSIAKENTWQMVKLLGLVYLICILLTLPACVFFSGTLSRPISRIIDRLRETAGVVFSMATQVTSASRQLAEGASAQAASLEETSSSLEEFSSMTSRNAEHARKADGLSKQGVQYLKDANVSMKALIGSMQEISTASGNVANIIKTIDQIAFQTNLLALNAAVEAARAGEAGAGFAVVAEEVRNLALRSAEASKNTQDLLQEIIQKIENGSTLVNETDDKYRNVAINIGEVTKLVEEISVASEEQAHGIQQVNTSLGHIDQITQQNASGAEESASASQELNAQAEKMQGVTDDLADIVGSGAEKSAENKARRHSTIQKAAPPHTRAPEKVLPKTLEISSGEWEAATAEEKTRALPQGKNF